MIAYQRLIRGFVNGVLWYVPLAIVAIILEVEMTWRVLILCVASEVIAKLADSITDKKENVR